MKKLIPAIVLCAVLLVSATFVNADDGNIPTGGFASQQTVQTDVKSKSTTVWDFIASYFGIRT